MAMESGSAGMGATGKRLALTRDQRSVLEAVYVIEKLPDANLRERLSSYLNLSTRQIQVWFQNRRQRAKTSNAAGKGSPKKSAVCTPNQIMDALFEFGDSSTRANHLNNLPQPSEASSQGDTGPDESDSYSSASASHSAASQGGGGLVDVGEGLEWQLPTMPPTSFAMPIAEVAAPSAAAELNLDAAELWPLPNMVAGTRTEPLFTHFAPHVNPSDPDIMCCRSLLGTRLCESVAGSHELAWYGVTAEQKQAFARAGVSLRTLVGIPCLEAVVGGSATLMPPSIGAILVLYSRRELPQTEGLDMLLHTLGSAAVTAYTLGANRLATPAAGVTYATLPAGQPTVGVGAMLLAAARALDADIAEHWAARRLSHDQGGLAHIMTAEVLLISERLQGSPDVIVATGASAEPLHPFSSHMSRAAISTGKLVWCNPPGAADHLDGLQLPMKTAVSLPVCDHNGEPTAFIFYSLRRTEQPAAITYFLAQLQMLAASSYAAMLPRNELRCSSSASSLTSFSQVGDRSTDTIHSSSRAGVGIAAAATTATAATAVAPRSAEPSVGRAMPGWQPEQNQTPDASVMSTQQVLSLFD